MISIETYMVGIVVLIALFALGMYAVYKDNVLGFVSSGFATITMIVFTVLGGFGRVGNVENIVLYSYNYNQAGATVAVGNGTSTITPVTSYIDSSIVYLSGFISIMMVVILLFIIGRYIATLTLLQRGEKEDEE